jgi:ribosomal protein S18 acetylase RimI-like enzyme
MLRTLLASTRPELALLPGTQAATMLDLQLRAQAQDYRGRPGAHVHDVVMVDGEAAGRVWLVIAGECVQMLDLSLLPAYRGRGVGGMVLGEILRSAAAEGRSVTLMVAQGNPARSLYERLGFTAVHADAVHTTMEWRRA